MSRKRYVVTLVVEVYAEEEDAPRVLAWAQRSGAVETLFTDHDIAGCGPIDVAQSAARLEPAA